MRNPSHPHRTAAQALAAWLLVVLGGAPPYLPAAWAGVEGEHVKHGKASFERDGDLTVIRPSNNAIIDYSKFDILKNETVRFEQPSAKSRVLNRVFGDATHIDGALEANGIVYIVNSSGIFFGGDAVVDVGRLVAGAGNISNDDFLRGVDAFTLTGPLVNEGDIHAQSVELLGRHVSNFGSIVAPAGVIALVAGDRAVLTQLDRHLSVMVEGPDVSFGDGAGIEQAGLVDAGDGSAIFAVGDHYSLALNHTGITRGREIEARGGADGTVRVSGTLDASTQQPGHTGGRIRVTGTRVELVGATLDASGAAGGGQIRVGGDLHGAGPMRNALRTFVDADSVLRADALTRGNGGSIVVFADQAAGFLGTLSARGGLRGGNGGFAELSSGGRLVDQGTFDLGAPNGTAGTLLYDPQDILIVGGTQDGDDSNSDPNLVTNILFGDADPNPEPFEIHESEIEGTDANIQLEARNSIRASGTFDHDAGGEGVGVLVIRSGNDLTMTTRNAAGDETGSSSPSSGIDLTTSAHGADLEIRSSGDGTQLYQTGSGDTDGVEGAIRVGKLTTTGGSAILFTEDGSIMVNTITTTGLAGATGGNGGNIQVNAGDKDGSGQDAVPDPTTVTVTGDLTARGGDATGGNAGNGGSIQIGTRSEPVPPFQSPAPLPDAKGGGATTIGGNLDTRGGSTTTGNGGIGGSVLAVSAVHGDVQVGDITTLGGNGLDPAANSNGGRGGSVRVATDNGDIQVGAIDARGGDSDGSQSDMIENPDDPMTMIQVPLEFGGSGGTVQVTAGRGGSTTTGAIADPHGSVMLEGRVTTFGGGGTRFGPGQQDGTGPGGTVVITAHDQVQHGGVSGPQIATNGDVTLSGADIGSAGTFELDGGGAMDSFDRPNSLTVAASDNADVHVATPGFELVRVQSKSTTADIDIVQGGDQIRMNGDTVNRIDTTTEHTDVIVKLQDDLDREFSNNQGPANDVALNLVVPNGSIDAGGTLILQGEDDITIGDGAGVAITAHEDPDTDRDNGDAGGVTAADIGIEANIDSSTTGSGAILDGGGRIDRAAGGADPGLLQLRAATGIGASGAPIGMQGGGGLGAVTTRSGGVFLRNQGSGDVTVKLLGNDDGVRVLAGNGDIVVENTAGDLTLERGVRAPGGPALDGGNITVAAPGGTVFLATPSNIAAVDAAGDVQIDGAVALTTDSTVRSRNDGDVHIGGPVDTDPATLAVGRLSALTVDTDGVTTLAGDVGATTDLRNLSIGGGVDLVGDRTIKVTGTTSLGGDVRGTGGDDAASLTIVSGRNVQLGGNLGVGGRLSSFTVLENPVLPPGILGQPVIPTVVFDGTTDQSVSTGAGGIAIDAAGRPEVPNVATVGKTGGGLTLQSAGGSVLLGQNEKLTAQGVVNLSGTTVRMGDVSATELHVTSADAHVMSREPGGVLLKGGESLKDQGADIVANVVSFSSAPTVDGTGTVKIAAKSATNPGLISVVGNDGVDTSRMVNGKDIVLDLGILPADPGHETPERGPVIEGLVPPRTSSQAATGTALGPSAEETLAWLRCASEGPADCPPAPHGSALDSPRGRDLAVRAEHWLGNTDDARAARAAVARLDPGALRELALFLTEVRLLGLSDAEYAAVRDALYGEVLADAGAGAPAPDVLAQGVRTQARGVPL